MIYILFILITILLIGSIVLFRKDATSPVFLLNLGFWLASLSACSYASIWNFQDPKLIIVVISGLLSFNIGAFLISQLYVKKKIHPKEIVPVNISKAKLNVFFVYQLLLLVLEIRQIALNIGGFSLGAFSKYINLYYEMNKAGELTSSSSLLNIAFILNVSAIYYLIYVLTINIYLKKKIDPIIIANIILGIIISVINGTKTTVFMYALAIIVSYFIVKSKSNGWRSNINIKFFIRGILIATLGIGAFVIMNQFQGRTMNDVPIAETIATYLGAPLKNLEIFLGEDHSVKSSHLIGVGTFNNTYAWIFENSDKARSIPNLYKYRWLNGHGLGNVYTALMPQYYDFGLPGCIIIMFLFGTFSQQCYEKIRRRKKMKSVDYYAIWYSFMSFAIFFSFFSNKPFEMIFARAGIYFIGGLYFFDVLFRRLKVNHGKLVVHLSS